MSKHYDLLHVTWEKKDLLFYLIRQDVVRNERNNVCKHISFRFYRYLC